MVKFWSRFDYFCRFQDQKLRQISSNGFYFSENLGNYLRCSAESGDKETWNV